MPNSGPHIEPIKVVSIVHDASLRGDKEACRMHHVSQKTVQRYRERVALDANLRAMLQQRLQATSDKWSEKIDDTIAEAIDFLKKAAQNVTPSVDSILAVTAALKTLSEIRYTGVMLNVRIAQLDREAREEIRELPAECEDGESESSEGD